jgi:hypothetical protein
MVALRHDGEADARGVCMQLGVNPETRSCTQESGASGYVILGERELTLSLSGADGNPYEVTAADVTNALALEPRIASMTGRVIDPPLTGMYCVSPSEYPELWSPRAS